MRWNPNRNERSLIRPIVLLLGVVFLSGADRNDERPAISSEELEARRDRIEKMSESDRNRLTQNLSRFLAFPAAKQDDLIELHQELDQNQDLLETKRQFEEWLNQLSPWQRQELVRQTTVEGKLAVVTAILQEQEQQRLEQEQLRQRVDEIFNEFFKPFGPKPTRSRMSSDYIDSIISFLEKQIPEDARPSKKLSRPGRRAAVLLAVLDHFADRPNAREEPIPMDIYEELRRKVSLYRGGTHLFNDNDEDASRNFTRTLAGSVIYIGYEEILNERERPRSHEEWLKYLDKFDTKYRREFDETFERSREEALRNLSFTFTKLYIEQNAPDFRRESDQLRERMRSLGLFRDWPPRRGGGRGPSGGPDREGRGPNNGPDREERGPGGPGRGPMFNREGERRGEEPRFRRSEREDR